MCIKCYLCVSYIKSLALIDVCYALFPVLTSNHLSVSICYGYRRLVFKRRKPRWGNFLYKLPICVYIGIKSGKSITFFSVCGSKDKRKIWTYLCPKSYESCRHTTLFSCIILSFSVHSECHFFEIYISSNIFLSNFFDTPPPTP